ncbi:hypothetical protein EZJ43_12565 [Pedobacter changchengzhani]|uniref:Uncharacterized protein n=1 Tax=Pedobacter changchengzhani TaxID=2529274 RepID=A0A4R5MIK5_9SPHI|nr:hypothetical protein [Pedobacter changchengzhani]TDG35457.1 hypothetical protein EZJ43_12565 [Pedobacter changchengzhani]
MKKLTILMLCIATLGLASCKKETIVNQTTPNRTITVDVLPSDWVLSVDRNTYSVQLDKIIDLKEINSYHLNNEGTIVAISYPSGGNFTSYAALPFVYNLQSYSYTVYSGGILIEAQNSDKNTVDPIKPTTKIRVKITLVAADNVT